MDKKKIKKILLKTIIITLILEILVFNMTTFVSFFRTIGKEKREYNVNDLNQFVGDDKRTVFEIRDINIEISTVRVAFSNEVENPLDYNLAYRMNDELDKYCNNCNNDLPVLVYQ